MKTISDLNRYVSPYAPGCPDFAIEQEFVFAARRLCERAYCWNDGLVIDAGVATLGEYSLTMSTTQADISSIHWVKYEKIELTQKSFSELNAISPEWPTELGAPLHYLAKLPDKKIVLYRKPTVTNAIALEYELFLKPTIAATQLPDIVVEHYLEVLIDGVLSRLLSIPDKEWTNRNEALIREMSFNKGIADAREKSLHGISVFAPLCVEPMF